jgi:hypothetical protein
VPYALILGPAAAALGIVAIFFVFRRKSVDKRSMYSARRSQIEHKVRAARQRTLTPHGRAERPEEAAGPASPFGGTQAPIATYEASAYEPPPAAAAPAVRGMPDAPTSSPWDVGPTAAPPSQFEPAPSQFEPAPGQFEPAPGQFDAPVPGQYEAPPAAAPPYQPAPSEPVWTPAPEPAAPVEPVRPAETAASPAAWSVVGEAKESAETAAPQPKKKKGKDKGQEAAPGGSWTLASGNAPSDELEDEGAPKAPGQAVAIAQYAVLVVGLVAVLIGVLIMVAGLPAK